MSSCRDGEDDPSTSVVEGTCDSDSDLPLQDGDRAAFQDYPEWLQLIVGAYRRQEITPWEMADELLALDNLFRAGLSAVC